MTENKITTRLTNKEINAMLKAISKFPPETSWKEIREWAKEEIKATKLK